MKLICNTCPNGCELTLKSSRSGTLVSGNYCPKGIAFAVQNGFGLSAPFRQELSAISREEANRVLSKWNLIAHSIKGSALIQGSPERSLRRTVVDTGSGKIILEQIEPAKVEFREMVATLLSEIETRIPVVPYRFGTDGNAVQNVDGSFWMIHQFVDHDSLDRELFWKDSHFGKQVGEILVNLLTVQNVESLPVYSPKEYLNKLVLSIGKTRIDVRKSITPILEYLNRTILPEIDSLPKSFSHGDSHPLNMLWKENWIAALIDWEFCGIRPRIYDTALVIGCVATESEESIDGGFVRAVLERMNPLLSEIERKLLGPMIVLNRFNWLSEWLRRHDEEMIEFEIGYMKFLMERFEK